MIKSPKKSDIKSKIRPVKVDMANFEGHEVVPHNIKDRIWENDRDIIFFKANGSEYILQPKAMLYRGSMCTSELYSKKQ